MELAGFDIMMMMIKVLTMIIMISPLSAAPGTTPPSTAPTIPTCFNEAWTGDGW